VLQRENQTDLNANALSTADEYLLVFTRKFFGGMRDDIRRRLPFYVSDFTEAFLPENRSQALAGIIFAFFACFSPAVTFGMLYDNLTGGQFGIIETILAT